ncbi:unnamed protein product [Cryptosporidium hominis]|uniref:Uncharacterized protein n=1 Tax=Cryptosporidium hominis TaxID=237895 RepID=A0A0S4TH33_CRYHO|nr:hypothetical protein ChTU502y2012_415g0210 [Cryptosporidium hominis]PPA63566.1 hypothetical protein ChUKH1_08500 [Cryptosporidium hominis]PPS97826.1 Uncharacterized protein GY17_00000356 [Cryptosporidium hominis]CUV06770.1 unnamed protein product [Cryptosporidium hominis]|eukprot:PPS97826.1 Uncharacterized protein GY17_00000356 [Cryptosporidium hominis]
MNDFDIIESQLAKINELRNQVEGIEKTNFNNVNNRTIIDKNLEISISSESTLQERYKSINLLYLVGQKKLIREIINTQSPSNLTNLIKRMINTPPIGDSIEKMACNRNTWIDESIWQLSKVSSEDNSDNTASGDVNDKDKNLSEILELLNHYKYHFDSSLQLSGAINLSIGMLNNSNKEESINSSSSLK